MSRFLFALTAMCLFSLTALADTRQTVQVALALALAQQTAREPCLCSEGDECTCGAVCECAAKVVRAKKVKSSCLCSAACTCGCQDGYECTCGNATSSLRGPAAPVAIPVSQPAFLPRAVSPIYQPASVQTYRPAYAQPTYAPAYSQPAATYTPSFGGGRSFGGGGSRRGGGC